MNIYEKLIIVLRVQVIFFKNNLKLYNGLEKNKKFYLEINNVVLKPDILKTKKNKFYCKQMCLFSCLIRSINFNLFL
jgi:hypothetical protein